MAPSWASAQSCLAAGGRPECSRVAQWPACQHGCCCCWFHKRVDMHAYTHAGQHAARQWPGRPRPPPHLHHVDAPVAEVAGQVRVQHHVILLRRVAEHVGAMRRDGAQLDHQRVLAPRRLVVLERRASAAAAVPILRQQRVPGRCMCCTAPTNRRVGPTTSRHVTLVTASARGHHLILVARAALSLWPAQPRQRSASPGDQSRCGRWTG